MNKRVTWPANINKFDDIRRKSTTSCTSSVEEGESPYLKTRTCSSWNLYIINRDELVQKCAAEHADAVTLYYNRAKKQISAEMIRRNKKPKRPTTLRIYRMNTTELRTFNILIVENGRRVKTWWFNKNFNQPVTGAIMEKQQPCIWPWGWTLYTASAAKFKSHLHTAKIEATFKNIEKVMEECKIKHLDLKDGEFWSKA